ncbi:hypothetical protein [Saccharopolyspora hattusasensis]|uniref:hypothetical protein n=1 Tax=Saccharopolyspora hattusasensis TaxID=1128679 RepID=UPI003D9595AA
MPVTPGPDTFLDRIKRLEARVDELARGTLTNAVISEGGITVRDLGGIQLADRDGQTVFFVGGLDGQWQRPDGSPQPATFLADDRGAWRIAVIDDNPGADDYRQSVSVYDHAGNRIVGDDVPTGEGLARPYIPVTIAKAGYGDWPATTAGEFEPLEIARFIRQHPVLELHVRFTSDRPDTRGELRFVNPETKIPFGEPVPVDFSQDIRVLRLRMPGRFGDLSEITLQARRTIGTGAVRATISAAIGTQS